MGLFLETVIIQHCEESAARIAFKKLSKMENPYVISDLECRYKQYGKGTLVLLNEDSNGYERLAGALSEELHSPVMLLYIYDEDFWGYYFYENGKELDCYNPMPDYFDESISEEDVDRFSGRADVIAKYFDVNEEKIQSYLITWTDEIEEQDDNNKMKAYDDDVFGVGECWQVTDFMRKIGYPYAW